MHVHDDHQYIEMSGCDLFGGEDSGSPLPCYLTITQDALLSQGVLMEMMGVF